MNLQENWPDIQKRTCKHWISGHLEICFSCQLLIKSGGISSLSNWKNKIC